MEIQMSGILNQMLMFFVILAVGFVANKTGMLKGQGLDHLSALICKIIIPLMVATMIPNNTTKQEFLSALPFLLAGACLILTLWGLSILVSAAGHLPPQEARIYQAMATFGNMGFMGIPLLIGIFGNKAMVYIALYSVADHFLLWTLGYYLASNSAGGGLLSKLKLVLNPCVIGILLGTGLMLAGFNPNNGAWQALTGIGNTTTYLALLYLGAVLAEVRLKDALNAKSAWLIVFTKMVAFPIILFAILNAWNIFPYTPTLILATIAGLPSMVTIVMLSRLNGKNEKYAACGVFITTLTSLISLPFVIFICNLIANH